MTTDDRALIEAMREGDEFAFVSPYNRYKDQVYSFCLKMLLNEERAADVMQICARTRTENGSSMPTPFGHGSSPLRVINA
jgi:hypothetical protein